MRRTLAGLITILALTVTAPCAFAEDAKPAAPAAAPAAPMPPPAATVVGDCCGGCQASTCCPPRDRCRPGRLEIQAGASLLRPSPSGEVTRPSAAADRAIWDSVDYGIAISGRVAWTFAASDWDITAAGTFWGRWDEDETLTNARLTNAGGGNTVFPVVPLHSEALVWDVNVYATKPFYCTPCFTASWGGGVRYLRFDEEASFSFSGNPATDTLTADIDNGLIAAEAVVEGKWKLSSRWDFLARVSAFGGWMHTTGDAIASGPAVPGFANAPHDNTNNGIGYGGEIEIALHWHMNSCWTFSIGYDFLALGQVARGFKGVDSSFTAPIDLGPILSEDWITVHRAYIGVVFDL